MSKIPRRIKRALLFRVLPALGLAYVAAVIAVAVLYGLESANQHALAASLQKDVVTTRHTEVTPAGNPTTRTKQVALPPHTPVPAGPSAAVLHRVQTSSPVLFITIDDGVTPDQAGFDLLRQHNATATLFLNNANIHRHYDYFKQWRDTGSSIQNHTDLHLHLPMLTAEHQKTEICSNADRFEQVYGARPTLFRPPYGEYTAVTSKLAAECGQKYTVLWSSEVQNGQIKYDSAGKFMPGEIVLLHFTPELAKDLQAVFTAADAQHLQVGKLEDWLR